MSYGDETRVRMTSIQIMENTHSLVHELVDAACVPPRTIWNMQPLHVVIVHLKTADVDVCLQVALELLPLASGISDIRVWTGAQLAPVVQVVLSSISITKPLQHEETRETLDMVDGPLEYLTDKSPQLESRERLHRDI